MYKERDVRMRALRDNNKYMVLPITKKKYISFTKHIDSTKDNNEKNFQKKNGVK